uniref:EF-hand domain-containing protein n=2 Tax=Alexandrium monilatum TaxID=311494 RepID=A0A7S4VHS6_9DINO
MSTLRQVIFVHRHGARFPTRPTGPEDLSWPQRTQFWDSYRGHLTPVGSKQLADLGEAFRDHYVASAPGLFHGLPALDGNAVVCYTSNVQRTLQSAWSFLLGALGCSTPVFFAFRSDRVISDRIRRSIGVPIFIEDAPRQDDKLFHEWRLHDDYDAWLKDNQQRSPVFHAMADDPRYWQLISKLQDASGLEKLGPDVPMLDRLVAAKDLDTMARIDEAHALPVLPNTEGISLTVEERSMLYSVGNEVKRCWFQDSAAGDVEKSFGRRGAGYLGHKIWRHLHERSAGRSRLRLVEFSCHDTTIAALANHLGIQLPEIDFAAYFVFELHDAAHVTTLSGTGASMDGQIREPAVRILYNPSPSRHGSFAELVPRVPRFKDPCVSQWDQLPVGALSLSALQEHLQITEIEECFQNLVALVDRRALEPTRQQLFSLLERSRATWLSLPQWRLRYLQSFQAFDKDNDGRIGIAEVQALLNEWGHNSDPRVPQMLWELFDCGPEDTITDEEFYLMMRALVGVRGNISAWTQQAQAQGAG